MAKYLPILFGLTLGWFISHPPTWITTLGTKGYVLGACLAGSAFVAFICAQILGSLPDNIEVSPYAQPLPESVTTYVQQFEQLGFEPGSPLTAHMSPPALVVPLYHREENCMGLVFQTGTVPPKTSCDFLSRLEGDETTLTTGREAGGGNLPGGDCQLRQLFPQADPATLHQRHLESLDYLARQGLGSRPQSQASFETDFKAGFRRGRQFFLKSPLLHTLITLWRVVTGRNPHLGSITQQPHVRKHLERK